MLLDDDVLQESFIGTAEGSISILLTLLGGYVVATQGYLDRSAVKKLSKLSSSLFLPCLLIVQMGPELTVSNLSVLWVIPLWGLLSTVLAHLFGWLGQYLFSMPYWTIVASGRPNSSALPLLLLQSLEYTGVLEHLGRSGESVADTLARAKSYILLNAIIQQTFTFQFAPWVLRKDKKQQADGDSSDDIENPRAYLAPERHTRTQRIPTIVQDREHVGLLQDHDGLSYGTQDEDDYSGALKPVEDRPDVHWPSSLESLRKPLKNAFGWMSAPLVGAIIAFIIGMIPSLHEAFLSTSGPLYNSFTQALKNVGDLFVALQIVIVGAELALVPQAKPGFLPSAWSIGARFVVMPALGMLFVWTTAGRSLYIDDKLVWFLLILIPSGPSAMLLVNVAELENVDQGVIAGYLIISYLISPLMSVICALGVKLVVGINGG